MRDKTIEEKVFARDLNDLDISLRGMHGEMFWIGFALRVIIKLLMEKRDVKK